MGDEQERRQSYRYWCFNCKRRVSTEDIIRKLLAEGERSKDSASTTEKGYLAPYCPYCGAQIKRNYKIWCPYCQRTAKASELILHRTLDNRIIRLCPHCGLDRPKKPEYPSQI